MLRSCEGRVVAGAAPIQTETFQIDQCNTPVTVKLTPRQLLATDLQPVVGACMHFMRYDNARHFIFDMQGVEFMTSPCLVSLILFMQDLKYTTGTWCGSNVTRTLRVCSRSATLMRDLICAPMSRRRWRRCPMVEGGSAFRVWPGVLNHRDPADDYRPSSSRVPRKSLSSGIALTLSITASISYASRTNSTRSSCTIA
jgi:hypothetical protein